MQAPVDEVVVKAVKYSACVDVIESDHKPVWALLALDVPVTNQEKKRRMCSHILKQAANQGQAPERPALQVSRDSVQLKQVRLTAEISVLVPYCVFDLSCSSMLRAQCIALVADVIMHILFPDIAGNGRFPMHASAVPECGVQEATDLQNLSRSCTGSRVDSCHERAQ